MFWPCQILAQENKEGCDIEEKERLRALEIKMQNYPQITSLREANLLLGKENQYGIYQIGEDTAGRDYQFENLDFIENQGYQVKREDYELVYTGKLWPGDSLDSLYERFNINHPEDFTGHSMSVSDVVVLNEGGTVKAFFVDSFRFRELPDFLPLEAVENMEENREPIFEAWVGNIGEINRGNLKGDWIIFPCDSGALEKKLQEIGGEEQMIYEYSFSPGYGFLMDTLDDYKSPGDLNMVAAMLQGMDRDSLEAVEAYLEETPKLDICQLANLVLQAEDIPFSHYDFDGAEQAEGMPLTEKYGYTIIESNDRLMEELDKSGLRDYLDYEAIGRDAELNGYVSLGEKGYLNIQDKGVDLSRYGMEELRKMYGQDTGKEALPVPETKPKETGPRL